MAVGAGAGVPCCTAVGVGVPGTPRVVVPVAAVSVGKEAPGGVDVKPSLADGLVVALPVVLATTGNCVGMGVAEGVGVGGRETMVAVTDDLSTVADSVTSSRAASVAAWAPTLGFSGAN